MLAAHHHLLHELQRRRLVSGLAGEGFQHLALVIDRPPKVVHFAVDFHVDLVEVPPPVGEGAHLLRPLPAEHRAKAVPPQPHRLMADVDAALGQQVLHIPQRQRVLHVHHHHEADHLRRTVEVAERVGGAGHMAALPASDYRGAKFGLTEPARQSAEEGTGCSPFAHAGPKAFRSSICPLSTPSQPPDHEPNARRPSGSVSFAGRVRSR